MSKVRPENNILNRLKKRIIWALNGTSIKDKVRLILSAALYWLWGIRAPLISQLAQRGVNMIVRGAIIHYRGSKYCLVDGSTMYFFYEEYEQWMWSYLDTYEERQCVY